MFEIVDAKMEQGDHVPLGYTKLIDLGKNGLF